MARNTYIDAHLHLQDERFAGIIDTIVQQAESAGISRMFCNAVGEGDWAAVTALAGKYPGIVPFLGVHPWFCSHQKSGWQTRLADLLTLLKHQGVGIGETGLDTIRADDFELQRRCFIDHLEIAAALDLPVAIHCVKAWGALLDTLETVGRHGTLPRMMVHSFSGSTETMKRLVEFGCYISYGCGVADSGRQRLQDTLRQTPLTSLMLETDAPFQKNPALNDTVFVTGEHNEPVAVTALYRYTARVLNIDSDDLSTHLWNNAAIFSNQTADR